jgi:carbon storage regulator
MLFLTRKVGESIVINDNIELTVVEVRGKSIKLGFTFPPEAKVLRRELHDRIKADGVKADGAAKKADAADDIGSESEIPTVS